jgi:hypothetical protein
VWDEHAWPFGLWWLESSAAAGQTSYHLMQVPDSDSARYKFARLYCRLYLYTLAPPARRNALVAASGDVPDCTNLGDLSPR